MEPTADAEDLRLTAFWEVAKRHARLSSLPGYFGPSALESVVPPAWAFGPTPEQGEELLRALLATGSASEVVALSDYTDAGEPLPEVGTLGIVLDGTGAPVALVVTSSVEVVDGTVTEVLDLLHSA